MHLFCLYLYDRSPSLTFNLSTSGCSSKLASDAACWLCSCHRTWAKLASDATCWLCSCHRTWAEWQCSCCVVLWLSDSISVYRACVILCLGLMLSLFSSFCLFDLVVSALLLLVCLCVVVFRGGVLWILGKWNILIKSLWKLCCSNLQRLLMHFMPQLATCFFYTM